MKKPQKPSPAEVWAVRWLDTVASGASTMSQRGLRSLDRHGIDLRVLRRLAKQRGVHLLCLTDDQGKSVVAASIHPFKVLC